MKFEGYTPEEDQAWFDHKVREEHRHLRWSQHHPCPQWLVDARTAKEEAIFCGRNEFYEALKKSRADEYGDTSAASRE